MRSDSSEKLSLHLFAAKTKSGTEIKQLTQHHHDKPFDAVPHFWLAPPLLLGTPPPPDAKRPFTAAQHGPSQSHGAFLLGPGPRHSDQQQKRTVRSTSASNRPFHRPLRTTLLSVLDEVDQLVAGMENDSATAHSVVADVRQNAPNRKPEDKQHPEWSQ